MLLSGQLIFQVFILYHNFKMVKLLVILFTVTENIRLNFFSKDIYRTWPTKSGTRDEFRTLVFVLVLRRHFAFFKSSGYRSFNFSLFR